MWAEGLIARSIGRSCILTDFSWTNPLPFLHIMTGPPSLPRNGSLIFDLRRGIFGQNDLCPYESRRFDCHLYLKKLHFDRFFMDHPLTFSPYNDWVSVAPRDVLGHF